MWGEDLGDDNVIRGSWQDTDRDWFVSGEDPFVTFIYAGMASQFAYLLQRENLQDPDNIDWLAESINAFEWANDNYITNGNCQNRSMDEIKNYAAGALFRASENSIYEDEFIQSWNAMGSPNNIQGAQAYGSYCYAFNDLDKNQQKDTEVKTAIEATADFNLLEIGNDRSCRFGGNPYFPMLAGQSTTPKIVEGIIAYKLIDNSDPNKASEYWKLIHTTADYFLGNNPLRLTWITGLGENNPSGILHLDSWASGDGNSKSGIVPYGPWKNTGYTNMGVFHHEWPHQWMYPDVSMWPGHERWFSQRYNALGSEYTINQTNAESAFVYGALAGNYSCSETVNSKDIELINDDEIIIYPNPSSGYFRIQGLIENFDLKIMDSAGQVILQLPNIGNNYEINLSHLGAGTYFIQIEADNGKIYLKHLIKI